MLIPSDRHRPEDLRLWAEHERADIVQGSRPQLAEKVERSLSVIREFVAAGKCYCAVSWGKDSVVVAHLMRSVAPDVPLVYLRQSTENPDCAAVRADYASRFPGQRYAEVPVVYGGERVSHKAGPWKRAIAATVREFGATVMGIRADESSVRRLSVLHLGLSTRTTCRPIAWWTAADVFAYLAVRELPVHPVYAMLGNGRWPRDRVRTASIGGQDGTGNGRREWEQEYYGDVLRRVESGRQ